jgi:hypothetical protein
MSEIIFDAEVKSQFLMEGNLIERKGHVIQLTRPPVPYRWDAVVACWGFDIDGNEHIEFNLPYDLFVPIGMEV